MNHPLQIHPRQATHLLRRQGLAHPAPPRAMQFGVQWFHRPRVGEIMKWFVMAWSRAADFSGRSRRKEYWMFTLINTLIGVGLSLLCIFFAKTDPNSFSKPDSGAFFFYILMAYGLISTVPNWSCTVRRLHDTGRSGWWIFFYMIPLIGLIVLVFLALDSEPGRNEYGPNPKSPQQAAWII
jgi:uncharacterized membrane protein YhaH (DUF805 family)